MNLCAAIEKLVPSAVYGGAIDTNTREEYEALRWADTRPKPPWSAIVAADESIASLPLSVRLTQLVESIPDEVFADPSLTAFLGGARTLMENNRWEALALAIRNLPDSVAQFRDTALDLIAQDREV